MHSGKGLPDNNIKNTIPFTVKKIYLSLKI